MKNDDNQLDQQKKVVPQYIPPSTQLLRSLAIEACSVLGRTNTQYTHPEVVGGLSNFLSFYAESLAKYASNGQFNPSAKRVVKQKGVSRGK
ncbi:MAG: hypothetical protein J0M33_13430 [Anaerolineae bacterium]|nr:hypothetical protein [Anaerolineae bacterium]